MSEKNKRTDCLFSVLRCRMSHLGNLTLLGFGLTDYTSFDSQEWTRAR